MVEEKQQKIKVEKGKLQKISLKLLRGGTEEEEERELPEPKTALEEEREQPREGEEEKIIVEKVTPQIKTIPSEPSPKPPSLTVVEGERKGIPGPALEEEQEHPRESEEEKIIVEKVTPQIKPVPSEPSPKPPSPTVVEGKSKGIEPEPDVLIYQKVSDKLSKNLLENPVSITVKCTEVLKVDLAVLRFLMEKNKMKGIVICGDRPAMEYNKLLKDRGLDPDAAFYIDVITLFTGHEPTEDEKKPNVTFIYNPSDLTSLDIAITEAIESLNKETIGEERIFLLLDCLASLQMYSSHTRLGMFVHNLTTKLKIHDVYGVIFLLEENKGSVLSSTIQTFCDKNIAI